MTPQSVCFAVASPRPVHNTNATAAVVVAIQTPATLPLGSSTQLRLGPSRRRLCWRSCPSASWPSARASGADSPGTADAHRCGCNRRIHQRLRRQPGCLLHADSYRSRRTLRSLPRTSSTGRPRSLLRPALRRPDRNRLTIIRTNRDRAEPTAGFGPVSFWMEDLQRTTRRGSQPIHGIYSAGRIARHLRSSASPRMAAENSGISGHIAAAEFEDPAASGTPRSFSDRISRPKPCFRVMTALGTW